MLARVVSHQAQKDVQQKKGEMVQISFLWKKEKRRNNREIGRARLPQFLKFRCFFTDDSPKMP